MAAQGSQDLWAWPLKGELKYELSFPIETPSNNIIKGMHFHAYKTLRQQWRLMVMCALKGVKPGAPLEKAFIVVTRCCAGGGLDWDNAYGGLKPVLDCLVVGSSKNPDGLGLILDDNPRNMPYPPFVKQGPAPRGKGQTLIQIYAIAE